MSKIGNNNKIKNSIIGNNNSVPDKKDNHLITIIITITTGIIIGGVLYFLGWN